MKVLEFVNTHAPTLRPNATLQDAVDKLDLYQVTLLPVVDDSGAVVGALTETQVFETLFARWLETYRATSKPPLLTDYRSAARELAQTPIHAQPVPVLNELDPVEVAVAQMVEHGYDTLPVIGEGRFIGTVRLIDCCQALIGDTE